MAEAFELSASEVLLGAALFAVSFAVSTAIAIFVLIRLPAEYFHSQHPREFWIERHPVLRYAGLLLKNALGLVVFAVGVILTMPGIPGPGVVTILIAITLLDFPGKRSLERWLVSRPPVLHAINRLRRRFGREDLRLDP